MSQQYLTTDDLAAYAEDAAATVDDENILAKITRVARELRDAEEAVQEAQEALTTAQSRVRLLEESTLPDLMDEAGQKRLTTVDDYELERTETLRASIPKANLPAAVMWLRANNNGSIVKRKLSLEFGKDEDQRASEARDLILEAGFTPTDDQSVHPMTLAATIRELLEQGVNVPMELLGAFVQPKVKMKKAGAGAKPATRRKAS